MNMITKIVSMVVLGVMLLGVNAWWSGAGQGNTGTELNLAAVNGGKAEANASNVYQQNQGVVPFALLGVFAIGAVLIFRKDIGKLFKSDAAKVGATCLLIGAMSTGCIKPVNIPDIREVKTNESVFVIPLDIEDVKSGDKATAQQKLQSAEYFERNKVQAKRIEITKRWRKTGRFDHEGEWIPNVKIIAVDRSPITQEWMSEEIMGQNGKKLASKATDKAIWVESLDSIGFSMGWNCTAYIKDEDSANFLYWYSEGALSDVMNREIRGRIQMVAAEVSAKYKLEELRSKKNEIATAVKEDVVKFFALRGVTITTVGMFGGMTYENGAIQESIDNTFVVQQEKINATTLLAAQTDKNARIQSEAMAQAEATRSKMKGEADGKLSVYTAEADGILKLNDAIQKAGSNPMLVELRRVDVEKARVEKWTGNYPTTVIGAGSNTWVGLGDMKEANAKTVVPATK